MSADLSLLLTISIVLLTLDHCFVVVVNVNQKRKKMAPSKQTHYSFNEMMLINSSICFHHLLDLGKDFSSLFFGNVSSLFNQAYCQIVFNKFD